MQMQTAKTAAYYLFEYVSCTKQLYVKGLFILSYFGFAIRYKSI